MNYKKGDKVKASEPKSKWLTDGKEYSVEWVSTGGNLAVRNDNGKIKPYSKDNFELVESQYPEHDKLDTEKLNAIDEFVDYLKGLGYSICKLDKIGLYNGTIEHANHRNLRAKFFGTSEEALEKERLQMLEALRNEIN